jgi:hypothetical protein
MGRFISAIRGRGTMSLSTLNLEYTRRADGQLLKKVFIGKMYNKLRRIIKYN